MAYKRTSWKDHVVEKPKTFRETVNADGTKTLEDAPGEIIQQGTPMSATNFNSLEEGLQHVCVAFELYYATSQAMIRDLESRLALAEAKLKTLG